VVAAVGLTLANLFERPAEHVRPGVRTPLRPSAVREEALKDIYHEALVVVIVAEQLARGELLTDEHHRRLIQGAAFIGATVQRAVTEEPPEFGRLRRGEGRPF
jgi:hypothetical protein